MAVLGVSGVGDLLGRAKGASLAMKARLTARLWLRHCDTLGAQSATFGRPLIENLGRLVIGSRMRLNSRWVPIELVTGRAGVLEIGDGVYINYGTIISAH